MHNGRNMQADRRFYRVDTYRNFLHENLESDRFLVFLVITATGIHHDLSAYNITKFVIVKFFILLIGMSTTVSRLNSFLTKIFYLKISLCI